ncbi:MAG: penicillin-binding transpeptidase domain-containing protein [Verrucomicrobiales bacterium]|nr:penicillin-binding transpeptidase domain-containing protein [Verrucomicrobiales bacterium]
MSLRPKHFRHSTSRTHCWRGIAPFLIALFHISDSQGADAPIEALVETDENRKAPTQSVEAIHPQLFVVPAPRGLLLDRFGNPIAQTLTKKFLAIRLQPLKSKLGKEEAFDAVKEALGKFEALKKFELSISTFSDHWDHRSYVPLTISGPLPDETVQALSPIVEQSDLLTFEKRFVRHYPDGEATAHITGYVNSSMPDQHGPLAAEEPLWPFTEANGGLEQAVESLQGEDGKVTYLTSAGGKLVDVELIRPAVPGHSVITTLNLEMQKLSFEILRKSERAGAFVAIDSLTGDILALTSNPSFDPNQFVAGISSADYKALESDPLTPLFARATMGAYPPGSTFKPFVALAAMNSGVINGPYTRLPSPPSLEIDGRTFRNWNSEHEGNLDVRFALLRSSNTWFYQAGIRTGGRALLANARAFGFGASPDIELPTSSGNLPDMKNVIAPQAVANFSIGQGEVLTSPLQLACAMGGLSTGTTVRRPRLIIQEQDPETHDIVKTHSKGKRSLLNHRSGDRNAVRTGMWGVVNHEAGTGKAAAHDLPEVFGKTGTSQWKEGVEEQNLAWFAGYIGSNSPRIAFAVLVQGRPGESVSGGKTAAPLLGEFVKAIYAEPERFNVNCTVEKGLDPFHEQSVQLAPPTYTAADQPSDVPQSPAARLLNRAERIITEGTTAQPRRLESTPVAVPVPPTNRSLIR